MQGQEKGKENNLMEKNKGESLECILIELEMRNSPTLYCTTRNFRRLNSKKMNGNLQIAVKFQETISRI